MVKCIALLALLLASQRVSAAGGLELTAEELAHRPTLCVVPEMELVPEVDGWEPCTPDAFAEAAEGFKGRWSELAPWVAGHLTPGVARAISRWAKPQMEKYLAVPPLDKLTFKAVTAHKARGVVVYEATVDHLPVHNPLVTRRLQVYVLYAPETKTILRVTVTIRGEVSE